MLDHAARLGGLCGGDLASAVDEVLDGDLGDVVGLAEEIQQPGFASLDLASEALRLGTLAPLLFLTVQDRKPTALLTLGRPEARRG